MKIKILFAFILGIYSTTLFGQNVKSTSPNLKNKKREISISIPFIMSTYQVTNTWGIYGPDKQSKGKSWSNGINVTYRRNISKELFLIGGLGYFKQNFDFSKRRSPSVGSIRTSNSRPFLYDSQLDILFSTKHYSYSNYAYIIGIGYNYPLNKKIEMKGDFTYNRMNTYKQKYYPDFGNYKPQINEQKRLFSELYIFSVGVDWKLNREISVGISALIPIITKYHKDYIFKENTDEYFEPQSSYGIGLSINYLF